MIKAIETVYKGYRFRGRTEARWAVFFDAIGCDWVYEEEGFDLGDGVLYLPDFHVKVKCASISECISDSCYVEVKGKGNVEREDLKKIMKLSEHFPVLVVGKNVRNYKEALDEHYNDENVLWTHDMINGDGGYPALFSYYNGEIWICGLEHDEWDGGAAMDYALSQARSAHFEHGEEPDPKPYTEIKKEEERRKFSGFRYDTGYFRPVRKGWRKTT